MNISFCRQKPISAPEGTRSDWSFLTKKANINRLPEGIQARPVAHDGRRSMYGCGLPVHNRAEVFLLVREGVDEGDFI